MFILVEVYDYQDKGYLEKLVKFLLIVKFFLFVCISMNFLNQKFNANNSALNGFDRFFFDSSCQFDMLQNFSLSLVDAQSPLNLSVTASNKLQQFDDLLLECPDLMSKAREDFIVNNNFTQLKYIPHSEDFNISKLYLPKPFNASQSNVYNGLP